MVNKDVWASWTPEDREIVRQAAIDAGREEIAIARKGLVEAGKPLVKELEALGVTVTDLNAEQRKAFADATKAVYTKWKPQIGTNLVDMAERRLLLANKELFTLNLKGIQAYIYLNPFIYKRQALCYFSIVGSPPGSAATGPSPWPAPKPRKSPACHRCPSAPSPPPAHCSPAQNSGPHPSTTANAGGMRSNHAPRPKATAKKAAGAKKFSKCQKKDDEIHVQHDPDQVLPLGLTLGR